MLDLKQIQSPWRNLWLSSLRSYVFGHECVSYSLCASVCIHSWPMTMGGPPGRGRWALQKLLDRNVCSNWSDSLDRQLCRSCFHLFHLPPIRMIGYHKASFQPHPFSHFTASHFTPFQRIPKGEKKGLNNETKHIFFFFKACPKKLRECLALCTQLPPAPSSSIFLSFPSSWWFLISPRCLGIAVFLEANLAQSLQMPPWVWIPWRRCLSSSTTCFFAGVPWQVINS